MGDRRDTIGEYLKKFAKLVGTPEILTGSELLGGGGRHPPILDPYFFHRHCIVSVPQLDLSLPLGVYIVSIMVWLHTSTY